MPNSSQIENGKRDSLSFSITLHEKFYPLVLAIQLGGNIINKYENHAYVLTIARKKWTTGCYSFNEWLPAYS